MKAITHEIRNWGEFFVLDEYEHVKVKRLVIKDGKNISYQYHNHRNEFWTVAKGNGQLVLDGIMSNISVGDSIVINIGTKHSVKAINGDLIIAEVQYGDKCDEEDIVRLTRDFSSLMKK